MSWVIWILAYLFDCVHSHTTWPRRNGAGCVYLACLDCGKELPYSLERMRVVTRQEPLADGEANCVTRRNTQRDGRAVDVAS